MKKNRIFLVFISYCFDKSFYYKTVITRKIRNSLTVNQTTIKADHILELAGLGLFFSLNNLDVICLLNFKLIPGLSDYGADPRILSIFYWI